MPQIRGYATPFAVYNPGFTGLGWDDYGVSASHSDYSNATGVMSGDLSGFASYEHVLTDDDLAIPVRSTFHFVQIRYTLGQSDLSMAGGLSAEPYLRYENAPPIYQAVIAPPYINTMNDYVAVFACDPNGYPWSRYSIFRVKGARLLFGLRTVIPDPYLASARLYWSECRFEVGFTIPAPVVLTAAATGIGVNAATLRGSLDPRSATSTYPVSWYFDYGTTASYGSRTAVTTGVTGDGVSAVSAAVAGLGAATVYHYRLVAVNGEATYPGADMVFATL